MSPTLKAFCGMLLCAVLLLGCDDEQNKSGCSTSSITLFDEPCLDAAECPPCDAPCQSEGGTSVAAPECVQIVGTGLYCACECEFCTDGGGGSGGDGGTGGDGGSGGSGGGGSGGSSGSGGSTATQ